MNVAEPIPLTPEILKKYGHLRNDNDNKPLVFLMKSLAVGVCFLWATDHLCLSFFDGNQYNDLWARASYVHQLQNIYFALTGEELDVALK